jgi:small-conductance mechanosensitive channel
MALVAAMVALATGLVSGPSASMATEPAGAPPIRIIVEVPNDEAGRALVRERIVPPAQGPTTAAPPQPAAAAPTPAAAIAGGESESHEMSSFLAGRLQSLRNRALRLVAAAPDLPRDLASAFHVFDPMENRVDIVWLVAAALIFMAGGFAAQRFAWWSARGMLNYILTAPGDTVAQRLKLHAVRVSIAILLLAAFLIGSLGAFLLFPWPPLFREIVLVVLAAALATRLSVALGRVVIAPGARFPHFRVLPLSTPLAWFWYRWLVWLMALFAVGWACQDILRILGMPEPSRDVLGAGWLAISAVALIVLVWRRQRRSDEPHMNRILALLLTVAILLDWIFGSLGMVATFWTLTVLVVLPLLISLTRDAVHHVAGLDDPQAGQDPSVLGWAVVIERALRALLVIAAAVLLARVWEINLGDIAMGETTLTRAVRGGVRIVIILLAADVVWKLVRTLIDSRVAPIPMQGESHSHDDSPEARRRQRLNTLLPILRNFLLVLIGAVAVLMTLDAIGIQIGPLLAGAGVVGIAIGFGAQTLVRDIISGIFYLLDDAFRVGEYIQTSSHKGTVESFSLRSVKLRHHRGPITTVPFGELGAVQNLSRDWVIDKITIGVTYDTDLDKVRKIVKEIGKALAADEELSPHIIEPLKMQGVEQMGEFAIQLRLKIMTKPGEQFVVRRKAYALLKKAFADNGIKFAVPTVQVAGGAVEEAAAAAMAERMTKPKTAAETQ